MSSGNPDCSRVVRRITTSAGNDFSPSETTNQVGMITEVLRNESDMMKAGWNADNSHCVAGRESFQNFKNHSVIPMNTLTRNAQFRTDGFFPGLVAGGFLILGMMLLGLAIHKKR
jgi:hypothetical protein